MYVCVKLVCGLNTYTNYDIRDKTERCKLLTHKHIHKCQLSFRHMLKYMND